MSPRENMTEDSSNNNDTHLKDDIVFKVTAEDLANLAAERTPAALQELVTNHSSAKVVDTLAGLAELLQTDANSGISGVSIEERKKHFGSNSIAEKEFDSFLKLCWDAVQDFVLVMLVVMGVVSIAVEVLLRKGEDHWESYIEGAAILTSVCIVTLVTAGVDYAKQGAFARLNKNLDDSNVKVVIRDGETLHLPDADILVGDIISVNSHALASIPADGVLLPNSDLKMNESSLTGESVLVHKLPGDVVLSGTDAVEGSGKLLVIAVGVNSVAGKIKARVYADGIGDDEEEKEDTPLTQKLETLAEQIGFGGTVAAVLSFVVMTGLGLYLGKSSFNDIVDYFIVAITVLAVAVPEGLPLAVTLALAFSSNKMMSEQNLVKHLESCETMGCATTICTDKTGTLTTNDMAVRAIYLEDFDFTPTDPSQRLADFILNSDNCPSSELIQLLANAISINTMNETTLKFDKSNGSKVLVGKSGNPTECAMLRLVHDLGFDYEFIRNHTRGRSSIGNLGNYLSEGKALNFSSARKMMSWVVPMEGGGFRLYCKGASEVILSRCGYCTELVHGKSPIKEKVCADFNRMIEKYAKRGMRTIAVAFRDFPKSTDFESLDTNITNSDGSAAYAAETELTLVGLLGIEDPLRAEVPPAIEKCYKAGIDVRMVTGDSPNTAVSIAAQAGILRSEHFEDPNAEMVAANLKPNILMEGEVFRKQVHTTDAEGKQIFNQAAFDQIWPHLRVLARSSPDDKLTLAHGLNQSELYQDEATVKNLLKEHGIKIFPDRQVIAMTGDGTNDAPALKRADIGFAMGIAGTQIAKDAADIILLDDNFASIVTAAKWGRNVYASIQKFLQFQLTVNIAAVITALVGAFVYQQSPLAAIQLLWVNLIMDSLASLALASEPPIDSLLNRPPVNRSDSMITPRMWTSMIGQASYQLCVIMTLLFKGPEIFGFEHGDIIERNNSKFEGYVAENSEHYTFIFNTFVWMQLFNEINCRHLNGEFNVFKGLLSNWLFCFILFGTAIIQVTMVQYGSVALHMHEGGLDSHKWAISLLLGFGSLPVQQVINNLFNTIAGGVKV